MRFEKRENVQGAQGVQKGIRRCSLGSGVHCTQIQPTCSGTNSLLQDLFYHVI